ncbi:unnamed protein product [Aphanomyces euteiches]
MLQECCICFEDMFNSREGPMVLGDDSEAMDEALQEIVDEMDEEEEMDVAADELVEDTNNNHVN